MDYGKKLEIKTKNWIEKQKFLEVEINGKKEIYIPIQHVAFISIICCMTTAFVTIKFTPISELNQIKGFLNNENIENQQ